MWLSDVQTAVPDSADDLQQKNPKTEDIRLHRDDPVDRIFRRHVPAVQCPPDPETVLSKTRLSVLPSDFEMITSKKKIYI